MLHPELRRHLERLGAKITPLKGGHTEVYVPGADSKFKIYNSHMSPTSIDGVAEKSLHVGSDDNYHITNRANEIARDIRTTDFSNALRGLVRGSMIREGPQHLLRVEQFIPDDTLNKNADLSKIHTYTVLRYGPNTHNYSDGRGTKEIYHDTDPSVQGVGNGGAYPLEGDHLMLARSALTTKDDTPMAALADFINEHNAGGEIDTRTHEQMNYINDLNKQHEHKMNDQYSASNKSDLVVDYVRPAKTKSKWTKKQVSNKIKKLMGEGYKQKQAVAISLNMGHRSKYSEAVPGSGSNSGELGGGPIMYSSIYNIQLDAPNSAPDSTPHNSPIDSTSSKFDVSYDEYLASTPEKYELRAPKGGIVVQGLNYLGGQVIPDLQKYGAMNSIKARMKKLLQRKKFKQNKTIELPAWVQSYSADSEVDKYMLQDNDIARTKNLIAQSKPIKPPSTNNIASKEMGHNPVSESVYGPADIFNYNKVPGQDYIEPIVHNHMGNDIHNQMKQHSYEYTDHLEAARRLRQLGEHAAADNALRLANTHFDVADLLHEHLNKLGVNVDHPREYIGKHIESRVNEHMVNHRNNSKVI